MSRGGPARARGAALAAALALAALPACGRDEGPAPAPVDPDAELRGERRVLELLEPCAFGGFYDRDLSDVVPVLVEKLQRGRPDALKRAKEELGDLGPRAFPVLGNAFHAFYADLMQSGFLENVVDALAFSATDEAHALMMDALRHPQESVRQKTLDGLARHARPEDFDVIVGRLPIETRELRRQSVDVLFTADRARAEELFLGCFERGEERDLWSGAAPLLATTADAEAARRCGELFAGLDAFFAIHLAAAAARFGHEPALEYLRAELRASQPNRRLAAVDVLQRARLVDELGTALLEDASADVRAIAASAFRGLELTEEQRGWLRAAMDDVSAPVQTEALSVLCSAGDPEALARALAQLGGTSGPLQAALVALRAPLAVDAELARSAFERLLERNALEQHRPLQQRTATFKALGQMPLADAARMLHEIGAAAGAAKLEGLRAHDWLMIQAANTGVAGRGYLAQALRAENDPLRRIDLADAIGSDRDDLAREALLELVEESARSPLERLFAAAALARVGPSWEVAPRLKRVAFAMQAPEDAEARAALQCLLWQWY